MESTSYIQISDEYFKGYPSAIVNRDTYRFGVFSPESYLLEGAYKMSRQIPAFADISITADFSDESHSAICVNASTSFAILSDDNFSLAFAITQDNVGPYDQTNYFADNSEGEMGGWESKPAEVSTYYNDVARGYYVAQEIDNTPGEEHSLSCTLPLDCLNDDRENFNLVAMVVNNVTGDIENAVMMKSSSFAGVRMIRDTEMNIKVQNGIIYVGDTDSDIRIFSSDGKLINVSHGVEYISLPSGIYIIKAGGSTQKVVL